MIYFSVQLLSHHQTWPRPTDSIYTRQAILLLLAPNQEFCLGHIKFDIEVGTLRRQLYMWICDPRGSGRKYQVIRSRFGSHWHTYDILNDWCGWYCVGSEWRIVRAWWQTESRGTQHLKVSKGVRVHKEVWGEANEEEKSRACYKEKEGMLNSSNTNERLSAWLLSNDHWVCKVNVIDRVDGRSLWKLDLCRLKRKWKTNVPCVVDWYDLKIHL